MADTPERIWLTARDYTAIRETFRDENPTEYVRADVAERELARLKEALQFYAERSHWRTRNSDGSLDNKSYGLGHHQTGVGVMEILESNCGQWVPHSNMVHGGYWQADAGRTARTALSGRETER